MQKIRKYFKSAILTIGTMGALFGPVLAPAVVYAQNENKINEGVCQGTKLEFKVDNTTDTCESEGENAQNRLNRIVSLLINIFSVVVGIVSVIMIVYGGFRYITSGGATDKTTAAKNTILYAVIGLVVVALAQVLVKFVFANAQKQ